MLKLPATPQALVREVIAPALALFPAGLGMDSAAARCLLVAISDQEAEIKYRVQQPNGPAHGLWQFERAGGVQGVLQHPATRDLAAVVCREAKVAPNARAVHIALVTDDLLACRFARLLLWSDARPLPAPTEENRNVAWHYYEDLWRPGKPRPKAWPAAWAKGLEIAR